MVLFFRWYCVVCRSSTITNHLMGQDCIEWVRVMVRGRESEPASVCVYSRVERNYSSIHPSIQVNVVLSHYMDILFSFVVTH